MTDSLTISVEALSDEVKNVYSNPQFLRGTEGMGAIDWTFAGNSAPFSVARVEGRIVGISAYVQRRMKFGTGEGIALQAVDSFVAPELRGRGVFPALARAYSEHARATKGDMIWGFPNEAAAPIWFNKLGWTNHGQVPFLIRPLRAGFFLRRLGIPGDIALPVGQDRKVLPLGDVGEWVNVVWAQYAKSLGCAAIRDSGYLEHRLFRAPAGKDYRVVSDPGLSTLVATREATKHGGRIAYFMEAMGGGGLTGLIESELARLRDRGVELALTWSYPWSPNYRHFRKCGFLPLPERLRPVQIWFGGAPISPKSEIGDHVQNWYISYLDSDTI